MSASGQNLSEAGDQASTSVSPSDERGDIATVPVFALVTGNIVGFSGTSAVPLWLGTYTSYEGVRNWVASAEILLTGLGSLIAAVLLARLGARRVCAFGGILAMLANIGTLMPHVAAFVIGRCLAGLALGAILASVNAVATERADAQKAFASMFLGQAAFTALFYLFMPELVRVSDDLAIFALLAALAMMGAFVLWRSIPDRKPHGEASGTFRPVPRAIAVLIGLCMLFIGQSMAWISLFAIAKLNGFSVLLTSRIMAFSSVAMMAGPLLARLIGQRFGLRAPLMVFAVLLTFDVTVISYFQNVFLFAGAAAGLVFLPAFGLSYGAALVGAIGGPQHASAMPAVITFGSAIGPALAAPLLLSHGNQFAIVAATVCLAGSMALSVAMLTKSRRV